MPKRKASTISAGSSPITVAPDMNLLVNETRRSARAVPRKSYIDVHQIDGENVIEDLADREASPDQVSEFSDQPSELDLELEHESGTPSEVASDELPAATPVRKKAAAKSATPKKTPIASTTEDLESTQATAMSVEEVQYDSDGQPIPVKATTKADKHRARDARAAEKYANFEQRPPTVDSDYVPVPFKGRLGYACLNTILRSRKVPVFCSRTTRIATINKEDKGMAFVYELGRQNAEDLSKVLEWNEKYGIRFFRLSSEMFPFASHPDYLYNLEHADKELRAAGAIANKYDHRITCHPGQFTQIASPTPKVFENAYRDLEFHNELLTRMRLDPQRDRDAVLILHLGGAYGDKEATLERFRVNYAKLSDAVKARLVLENDDMSWSVTDLLPLCQELNIPLVLDWHHHNIIRDEERFREGTLDIMPLLPAIAETWTRKNIKQKMHTSEARLPNHPLNSQRRSHSARVYHLPPCPDDMDLMIEAKDKEQAVFELSKTYNLQNPPLPPEVVGDGPGAKGDEAYWPEGQEIRLKVTATRVKKEPEYDSEGNEIKPTPKKKVKKEPVYDSEGNEVKPAPRKRVKKEPVYDPEGNEVKPSPKKRVKKEPNDETKSSEAVPNNDNQAETVSNDSAEPVEPKKRAARKPKAVSGTAEANEDMAATLKEEATDSAMVEKPKRKRAKKAKSQVNAMKAEDISSALDSEPAEQSIVPAVQPLGEQSPAAVKPEPSEAALMPVKAPAKKRIRKKPTTTVTEPKPAATEADVPSLVKRRSSARLA